MLRLNELNLKRNDLKDFKKNHKEMLQILPQVDNANTLKDYYHVLFQYYNKVEDKAKALEALVLLQEYTEKVAEIEKALSNNSFEWYSQMYENKELANLLKQNASIYKKYLFASGGVFTLIVLFTTVILLNFRKLRHKNKEAQMLNKSLTELNAKLEESNVQKNRILSIAAHDLRNPVGSIYSLSQLLKIEKDENEKQNLIHLVERSSRNATELINEILLMSSLDYTTGVIQNLKIKEVTLEELVYDIIQTHTFKAKDKNQKIYVKMINPSLTIEVDTNLIRIALGNILGNAIKFSKDNSEIDFIVTSSKYYVLFEIKDNGIGIPEELQKELFKSFSKAKRAGTNGEEPFGLGLYISKVIVDAHKGNIQLKSIKDYGTTFFVEIPIKYKA